jgi:hypothetical protein
MLKEIIDFYGVQDTDARRAVTEMLTVKLVQTLRKRIQQADEDFVQTHEEQGFSLTYRAEDARHQKGFAVGVQSFEPNLDGMLRAAYVLLTAALKKELRGGDPNTIVVGYWIDGETNRGYLDISLVIFNFESAMALARGHKQVAVYDFAGKRSLPVEDKGTSETLADLANF